MFLDTITSWIAAVFYVWLTNWKQALFLKESQFLLQATIIFVSSVELLSMPNIIRWHKNVTNFLVPKIGHTIHMGLFLVNSWNK